MACPACGTDNKETLFSLEQAPISCQQLFPTREAALLAGTGHLDAAVCATCGLIWNAAFTESSYSDYGDSYYCSFIASPAAREYQESLASRLNEILELKGKTVLEIGCGDGYFLKSLSALGAKAVGFEPSSTYELAARQSGITVIHDFFRFDGTSDVGVRVDLVVMRNVLEHLREPQKVLSALKHQTFQGYPPRYLFLEVPDAYRLLEENLYFDFYNDHISYFSDPSLAFLLRSTGWAPLQRIGPRDEFVRILSVNAPHEAEIQSSRQLPGGNEEVAKIAPYSLDILSKAAVFRRNFEQWRMQLTGITNQQIQQGKRIAVWGAGSRGVMLLASLSDIHAHVAYIVDSDRNKHRKYIPIGLPIYPVEQLTNDPVDCVLITSYTYFDEIAKSLGWFLAKGGQIIKVYPTPELLP